MKASHFFTFWPILLCFFILCLLFLFYKQQKKHWQLKTWQNALGLDEHLRAFENIYQNIDGFALSRQARTRHDVLDYIYGEIEFLSFIALLSLAKPNQNTVFYDLGSGIGKAVIASAMVFPIRKSVGVEILPELYTSSCTRIEHMAHFAQYKTAASKIHFVLGDFLTVSLDDANFVFINSSTIFGATWDSLCHRLNNLPQIETIITTSKPLISTIFTHQRSTKIQMSWGIVPAYIHFRKTIFTQSD